MRLGNYLWGAGIAATAGVMMISTVQISGAHADAVSDFYKGKSIDLIISTTPGGGYDAYGRIIARHMPRHVPGNPSIIPKNMPGAGGITAASYLYNIAPKTGQVFATVMNPVPFEPMFGTPQANYDATKFNWIGSANTEIGLVFVWKTSDIMTFEDLMKREVTVAATGGGSSTAFYYRLLNTLTGTKLKIISGYPGSTESFMALERGETEGFFLFWSTEKGQYQGMLRDKNIRNVVQFSLEKSPELPDIPFAPDYIKNDKDRQAFDLAMAPLAIGRPYLAPPDVPADRVKALQDAFMATMKDPVFLAELEKLKMEVSGVKSGPEVLELILRIYKTPKDIIDKVAAITKG